MTSLSFLQLNIIFSVNSNISVDWVLMLFGVSSPILPNSDLSVPQSFSLACNSAVNSGNPLPWAWRPPWANPTAKRKRIESSWSKVEYSLILLNALIIVWESHSTYTAGSVPGGARTSLMYWYSRITFFLTSSILSSVTRRACWSSLAFVLYVDLSIGNKQGAIRVTGTYICT